MAFLLNRALDDALYEFLTTRPWPPFVTPANADPHRLIFEAPSASYRATQIVPDIRRMLEAFPDLALNGVQDFQIDGEFLRLHIVNNDINLLCGHLVYS